MRRVPLLLFILPFVDACLPGGGPSSCGCTQCPCQAATSFNHQQPTYSIQRQVPLRVAESPSYYQGQYASNGGFASQPVQPVNIYEGKAPLAFPGEPSFNRISPKNENPPSISVDHTPLEPTEDLETNSSPNELPEEPKYQEHEPVSPEQIQVKASPEAKEDPYAVRHRDMPSSIQNYTFKYITYYNQVCTGIELEVSEKETISTATRKCVLIGCAAFNVEPDAYGSYTVLYLKSGSGRVNRKGHYCLSSENLPARSRRIIRKFEDSEPSKTSIRRSRFFSRFL